MDKKLRLASIILTIIGALDAAYLLVYKLSSNDILCLGSGGCATVNYSSYSEIYGIPVSLLGLLAYLVILGILLLEIHLPFVKTNGIFALFGIGLIGVLYSTYLTYIAFVVIHATCPFCIVSAVVITLIFILTVIRLVRNPSH